MITVEQAESIILQELHRPRVTDIDIHESVGRVLAMDVHADRDLPPFTRVTMDGIAIQYSSFQKGTREFTIEGTQAAGEPSRTLSSPDNCIEVMTGAMLPQNTDTVIRYEDIEIKNGKAVFMSGEVVHQQNLHHRGQDAQQGSALLTPGIFISAAEVALMASVGVARAKVFDVGEVAVVSTGNELVDIAATPEPWQVRKSNVSALAAALSGMRIASKQFHLLDDETLLETAIRRILDEHPIVILSGGVSKGKFDFVPRVLAKLGVEKKFHQVSQRPGKPFWFGRSKQNTVFALPGNPVSTYMCFYRYIKPWLEISMGTRREVASAILSADVRFGFPLTYFLQVKTYPEHGRMMARPHAGGGSGDFANLKDVDGFLELPLARSEFKAGEAFLYFPFR